MKVHSRVIDCPIIPTGGTVTLASFIPSVNSNAEIEIYVFITH